MSVADSGFELPVFLCLRFIWKIKIETYDDVGILILVLCDVV